MEIEHPKSRFDILLSVIRWTMAQHAFNVGTGRGYSVLEITRAFESASGQEIPYVIADRRPGDVATSIADPTLALRILGWVARRGLKDMCQDAWAWQQRCNV